MPKDDRYLTPPQIAKRYGVSPEKVLAWIRRGELRGINVATRPHGRPRYVVGPADLAAFEERRAVKPPPPVQRRRSKPPTDIIEYF